MAKYIDRIMCGFPQGTFMHIRGIIDSDTQTISQFIRGAVKHEIERLSMLPKTIPSNVAECGVLYEELDDADQKQLEKEQAREKEAEESAFKKSLKNPPAFLQAAKIDPNRKVMPCCRLDGTLVYEDEPDAYKYKLPD
jgi:hypothetical protein